jgi:hypothetical protein
MALPVLEWVKSEPSKEKQDEVATTFSMPRVSAGSLACFRLGTFPNEPLRGRSRGRRLMPFAPPRPPAGLCPLVPG